MQSKKLSEVSNKARYIPVTLNVNFHITNYVL